MTKNNITRRHRHWPSISGDSSERASKALTRLEDLTRMVAEWVWETDKDDNIIFVSQRIKDDLGFLPIQLVGKKITDIGNFIDQVGNPYIPNFRQPFRNLPFRLEDISGREHNLLVSAIPNFDVRTGDFTGLCGTTRDTSEVESLRKAEQALEKANLVLREATQAKSNFLANMSHELRTPLNAILGFSQVMVNENFGPINNNKYSDYANDIYNSGNHLLNLISDILDLSKVEANKFDLNEEKINLTDLIDNCIAMLKPSADNTGIELTRNIETYKKALFADNRLTRQMLLNLMSNSIKFTPRGGKINTTVKSDQEGSIIFEVADTGIGIPSDSFETIMMPFGQVTDTKNINEKGIGLGLALTKSFAEKHGGKIGIKSEMGKGTTISISFPPGRSMVIE